MQDFKRRFLGVHRVLDGWMLAPARASPAQDLRRNTPWYYNFPHFCMIVDQNCLERGLFTLLLRTLAVGKGQQSESIDVAFDMV